MVCWVLSITAEPLMLPMLALCPTLMRLPARLFVTDALSVLPFCVRLPLLLRLSKFVVIKGVVTDAVNLLLSTRCALLTSRSASALAVVAPMLAVNSVLRVVLAPVKLLPPSKTMALPATTLPDADFEPAVFPVLTAETTLSLTVILPVTWVVAATALRTSSTTLLPLTFAICVGEEVKPLAMDCELVTPTVPVNAAESSVDVNTLTAALLLVVAVMLLPFRSMDLFKLVDDSETPILAMTSTTSAVAAALKAPCKLLRFTLAVEPAVGVAGTPIVLPVAANDSELKPLLVET